MSSQDFVRMRERAQHFWQAARERNQSILKSRVRSTWKRKCNESDSLRPQKMNRYNASLKEFYFTSSTLESPKISPTPDDLIRRSSQASVCLFSLSIVASYVTRCPCARPPDSPYLSLYNQTKRAKNGTLPKHVEKHLFAVGRHFLFCSRGAAWI